MDFKIFTEKKAAQKCWFIIWYKKKPFGYRIIHNE